MTFLEIWHDVVAWVVIIAIFLSVVMTPHVVVGAAVIIISVTLIVSLAIILFHRNVHTRYEDAKLQSTLDGDQIDLRE